MMLSLQTDDRHQQQNHHHHHHLLLHQQQLQQQHAVAAAPLTPPLPAFGSLAGSAGFEELPLPGFSLQPSDPAGEVGPLVQIVKPEVDEETHLALAHVMKITKLGTIRRHWSTAT